MTTAVHTPHPDLVRVDTNDLPQETDTGQVYLFCKVRDEMLRLPYFIEYYRKLGVTRFIFNSNNSVDGTTEYLVKQPDCIVYETNASFAKARGGLDWTNALLKAHGTGHWILLADADELLVYPHAETRTLPEFCRWMDAHGYEGIYTLLLDMYAKEPISALSYSAGEDFLKASPYYDSEYFKLRRIGSRSVFPKYEHLGGPRHRLLYDLKHFRKLSTRVRLKIIRTILDKLRRRGFCKSISNPETPPTTSKTPLIRWKAEYYFHSNHFTNPVKLAPVTGALLHFKYFQDFARRVADAIERGNYFNGSAEYKRYAEMLKADPKLSFHTERSARFTKSDDLVRGGIIETDSGWENASKP